MKNRTKVLITWQKDDTSPFVAMRLKHENCFGGLIDRMATRFSTWFVFKTMNRRYASFLKQNSIEVHTHELNWRPECLVRLMKVNGRSIHRNSASDGCSLSSKFNPPIVLKLPEIRGELRLEIWQSIACNVGVAAQLYNTAQDSCKSLSAG